MFTDCFPGAAIHYAMKANSEPEILQHIADIGGGFEVASLGELQLLTALHIPPEKIIYGTSVKSLSHIAAFGAYGVERFAFDDLTELHKIASVAPGAKVYVRVNVNDATSVFQFSEKFGTDLKNVVPFLKQAQTLGLKPYGISFHVGSQAGNHFAWAEELTNLITPISELYAEGITIEAINIGGGFPCKYLSYDNDCDLQTIAQHTLEAYRKLPYQPQLILEPGRGIIAEAGILVASVIAKIERKNATWLFLDAGVYNALFEAMAYQGSTRYRVSRLRSDTTGATQLFAIAGPTGDSPDVITREALLPIDTDTGDKLVFHDAGAYSISVTSQFNGFKKPSVHFI